MFCIKTDIGLNAGLFFDGGEMLIEFFVVDVQRDFAEQLNESAVGVVGEAGVAGLLNQPRQGFFVESEIQNSIHHARHRNG